METIDNGSDSISSLKYTGFRSGKSSLNVLNLLSGNRIPKGYAPYDLATFTTEVTMLIKFYTQRANKLLIAILRKLHGRVNRVLGITDSAGILPWIQWFVAANLMASCVKPSIQRTSGI